MPLCDPPVACAWKLFFLSQNWLGAVYNSSFQRAIEYLESESRRMGRSCKQGQGRLLICRWKMELTAHPSLMCSSRAEQYGIQESTSASKPTDFAFNSGSIAKHKTFGNLLSCNLALTIFKLKLSIPTTVKVSENRLENSCRFQCSLCNIHNTYPVRAHLPTPSQ